MKALQPIAFILLIIGGLNWGLIGLSDFVGNGANWDVVNLLLGGMPTIESLVYVLVGVSAVWVFLKKRSSMM